MSYSYSSYYDASPGEYRLIPSDTDYNSVLIQPSATYPSYEYSSHKFRGYDPTSYYDSYDSGFTSYYGDYGHYHSSRSVASYSAYSGEPKYVECYQLPHYDVNNISSTQFVVSYSVSELNKADDVFEEYDPTPYGGGYDQASTYGKPLPPSNEICYPPSSVATPSPSTGEKIEEFAAKPPTQPQPTPTPVPDAEEQSHADDHYDSSNESSQGEQIDSHREEEVEAQPIDSNYGSVEDHGYDYFMPVNQVPSGYGLEAMDICESLFGYWPCLDRAKRNGEGPEVCDEVNNVGQWKETADYLFGGSYPYR